MKSNIFQFSIIISSLFQLEFDTKWLAALGLAGIGPDLTKLEIWADPALTRNTHHIVVDSDSAKLQMSIENIPTEENPGTGKITSLSLIACLRGLKNPLRVGS